ncbi:cytochrome c biogenesis protein ResB [Streptomonospora litoralis]|uniref:Cytochrome c biogenesis protein CcsB n=1 Tax=Streptomonospora litoralis TaxID=2498135 RepID=A0A4P6Q674_9ACTN|nr:cytochrome c biogenesis protein ResB [Streptomonospora litoralis]QBI56173.1 Cytochrome c biogenesis protein CcsB [Streptomonospora litoralis]
MTPPRTSATPRLAPAVNLAAPARLSPLGWARWAWRTLTSMRTALILLFLLAMGAIPGSMLPQRVVSTEQVQNYYGDHPDLAPWLDRFYLFDVYSSPWYAAIYLLLFVSLTGCVLPRAAAHYRAMRARPPRTPRNLGRMPYSATFSTRASPEQVLAQARTVLTGYRIDGDGESVAAEKGYLRESGNVVFHLALLALLVSLAAGSFVGYRGNMLVVEGDGFANTLPSYDAFYPGSAVDAGDLEPFSFTLEEFQADFIEDGNLTGQAASFAAELTYRASPESPERDHRLEVNRPLSAGGAQIYLLGHGYAPTFRVTGPDGDVVFDQPVPFIPREERNFTSDGVVKVPDTAPEQLGFTGVFLPSATENAQGELVSEFPEPRKPVVTLTGFTGDLGLNSGASQSVYQLDTEDMKEIGDSPRLSPGDSWELPGGSTVTFTGVSDYISMQVNSDPTRVPVLLSASTIVLGLLATLFVRPRRLWIRARTGEDGRTVVQVGGLDKTGNVGSTTEFHRLSLRLRDRVRTR